MSMLAWRSGGRARRPVFRLLPIIVSAFLVSAAFGVASIFSSNVTSETLNQVLLKGTRCGVTSSRKANSTYKELVMLYPWQTDRANQFLNYGSQCYTNETHKDGCNLYIKSRLPFESKRGIVCPFGDNICKLQNDNWMMDTGYLDSLEHLGINAPTKDRFQLRIVQKCAPIKTQGYMSNYSDPDYGEVRRYHYGNITNSKVKSLNFTHEVPVKGAYLPKDNTTSANIPRLVSTCTPNSSSH